MSVANEGLSAVPDSVAFKRLIRNMVRAQRYVPPYQPGVGALAIQAGATDAGSAAAEDGVLSQAPDWALRQNERGDLVAVHSSGAEVVIAANPEAVPDE